MTEGIVHTKYASQDVFMVEIETKAAMTSNLVDTLAYGFPFRVVNAWLIMTGAGAAGDTVKLQKVSGGSAADITDAVDVSAKADKAFSNFGTFDDAQFELNNGDNLRVVTVSDALCRVYVLCRKVQATP